MDTVAKNPSAVTVPVTAPPPAEAANSASVRPAKPLYEATTQPLVKKDQVEISDAARARLASEQVQNQKYVAQLSASREQTSLG